MRSLVYSSLLAVLFLSLPGLAESKFDNILFVGDSHSYGNFGSTMDAYLRTIGTKVTSVASCGSSPSNWISSNDRYKKTVCGYWRKDSAGKEIRVKSHAISPLPEELKKTQADLTVVALGTNALSSPQNIAQEKGAIEKMLNQIQEAKSRCIWVGPPDAAKQPFKKNLEQGVKEIRALVEKRGCLFIDSSKITQYPANKSDGIHYGPKEATEWGKKVTGEIDKSLSTLTQNSAPPLMMAPKASGVRSVQ